MVAFQTFFLLKLRTIPSPSTSPRKLKVKSVNSLSSPNNRHSRLLPPPFFFSAQGSSEPAQADPGTSALPLGPSWPPQRSLLPYLNLSTMSCFLMFYKNTKDCMKPKNKETLQKPPPYPGSSSLSSQLVTSFKMQHRVICPPPCLTWAGEPSDLYIHHIMRIFLRRSLGFSFLVLFDCSWLILLSILPLVFIPPAYGPLPLFTPKTSCVLKVSVLGFLIL